MGSKGGHGPFSEDIGTQPDGPGPAEARGAGADKLKSILVLLLACLLHQSEARTDNPYFNTEAPAVLQYRSLLPSNHRNCESRQPDQVPLALMLPKKGSAATMGITHISPHSLNKSVAGRFLTFQMGQSRHLLSKETILDPEGLAELSLPNLISAGGQQLLPFGDHFRQMRKKFSKLKRLGKTWYHLDNVCLRPSSQGGLHFYITPKKVHILGPQLHLVLLYLFHLPANKGVKPLSRVQLCNEHAFCQHFYYKLISSSAPGQMTGPFHRTLEHQSAAQEESQETAANGGARWFFKQEAVAVVEPFTGLSGWHLLHHLIPLSQLLANEKGSLGDATVHLHPTFFQKPHQEYNRHASIKRSQFCEAEAPFWPLLNAVPPPGVKALQVNLLEPNVDETALAKMNMSSSNLLSIPVCYESLYLGSPRMITYKGRGSQGRLWGEMKRKNIEAFRDRVVSLAGAENLRSGFCPRSGSSMEDSGKDTSSMAGLARGSDRIGHFNSGGSSEMAGEGRARQVAMSKWQGGGMRMGGWGKILKDLWRKLRKHEGEYRVAPLAVLVVRNGTSRRILNVDQVKNEVWQRGFQIEEVLWEKMSVWEQIRTARRADIVMGAHGNGLTHVFWMRPRTALIEFFPQPNGMKFVKGLNKNPRSNYGSFAAMAQVQHYAVEAGSYHKGSHQSWRNVDFIVNIPKFSKVLSEVWKSMDAQLPCD